MSANLEQYSLELAQKAKQASFALSNLSGQQKIEWLKATADLLQKKSAYLISENAKDVAKAPEYGLTSAAIDRLKLNEKRIGEMIQALHEVCMLTDPVGEVIEGSVRPNGLNVSRVRVPLGVVFFIFESRPNVTIDAASLCVKSGNAVILRGGKEALHSNIALHQVMIESLQATGLPVDAVQMVNTTDREVVGHLLKLPQLIDVTIPRGGKSLIERVSAEARMPVIKHFDGICHVYVHEDADLKMAEEILINSKCQRPGVCNAAETLLIDKSIASTALPPLAKALTAQGVTMYGCNRSRELVSAIEAASDENYRTEYLELKISVKVVDNMDAAIDHIRTFGSQHTESIVTNNYPAAQEFMKQVDSSAVMVNASTRFNDGGQLGLGAEIGISTDKFHARGPCGLKELTTYKYIVQGNGQVRT
jgi:glutamate-5-semialdehyde dehydrogenase